MERRWEQTVQGKTSGARRALYVVAWALLILLVLGMLVAAAGILGESEAGRLRVNALPLVAFVLLTALAALIWRRKDYLKLEYDYVLSGGTLEVWAILCGRRRRRSLNLPLSAVRSCGCAAGSAYEKVAAQPGLRIHKMYINENARRTYFCYGEGGARNMALLELNGELVAAVRADRQLPAGAWQDTEGKA